MNNNSLKSLYDYAAGYNFAAFTTLFGQTVAALPSGQQQEAYLLQAQIKLFAADITLLDDLALAGEYQFKPQFPCLANQWPADSANRFVVFPQSPAAVQQFLAALPNITNTLQQYYGEAGGSMARQMHSEICYFLGQHDAAIALAQQQAQNNQHQPLTAILAQYVLLRSYMGKGDSNKAEQCMLDIVRMVKKHSPCAIPYQTVRDWLNMTTGWSGDSPRFTYDEQGALQPMLEDRLTAIRHGISQLTSSEQPFADYALRNYDGYYTMRQYYMDIFNAFYWLQAKGYQQIDTYFAPAYRIITATGMKMPFIECGKQVIPLLQYIKKSGADYDTALLDDIIVEAERYENNINAYRI